MIENNIVSARVDRFGKVSRRGFVRRIGIGAGLASLGWHDLLVASPRDAAHADVAFDSDGQPVASDVARAAKGLVFISIELRD